MNYILVSLFGLFVVNRFFFRFRIANFISGEKSKVFFWISLLPILCARFFKDPSLLVTLYIGIFLLGLILFYIFFEKIMKIVFEKSKTQLLDNIVLQMRVGCSPQKALNEALSCCSNLEKNVFDPLRYIFSPHFSEQQIQINHTKHYILELRTILLSNSRILEQMQSFRDGLKIQHQFKSKTKQVTQQIKAQAMVAILIYLLMFFVSYFNLSLNLFPTLIISSVVVFLMGIFFVFKIGKRIKWKI